MFDLGDVEAKIGDVVTLLDDKIYHLIIGQKYYILLITNLPAG